MQLREPKEEWKVLDLRTRLKGKAGNKWKHVVAIYGEPWLRIYVNGRLVGEREIEKVVNPNTDEKLIPKPGFAINRGRG